MSQLEQMAVVVRYWDDDFKAAEKLISLTESSTVTGQTLADVLLSVFEKHEFDLTKLCAKIYDGAASMRGRYHGVQAGTD
jgi:Domain of unknown function (DUF4371)